MPITTIYLPNAYRCANGCEFKGGLKPEWCPVCYNTEIEQVSETELIGFAQEVEREER